MTVEVIKTFMDMYTGQIIRPGTILDVKEKRAEELKNYVKPVKKEKKERTK